MWYIILGLITTIYLIINLLLPSINSGFIGAYIIKPVLWASLALSVFLIAQYEGLNIWKFSKIRKWQIGRTPFHAALIIGGFQISILVIAGIILGFGKNPYIFTSPLFIITNIILITSMLFGIEISRAYFIKKDTFKRRNITLTLGLVTLLFILINIPLAQFTIFYFNNPAASIMFIGGTIIPLIAMSLFAAYLAYLGGAIAAIGYMGILQAFNLFSPIIPDLNWMLAALIGTLVPTFGFLFIQNTIQFTHGKHARNIREKKTKDPALFWTGTAIISLMIISFSSGWFGVQPVTILSGSMQPEIDAGDVVIISEVQIDEIQVGDIIRYRESNTYFVHRVLKIYEEENTKLFITKGDANKNPDADPVSPQQVIGKVVFNIPKIGWISIGIKEIFNKIGTSI